MEELNAPAQTQDTLERALFALAGTVAVLRLTHPHVRRHLR